MARDCRSIHNVTRTAAVHSANDVGRVTHTYSARGKGRAGAICWWTRRALPCARTHNPRSKGIRLRLLLFESESVLIFARKIKQMQYLLQK